jgi:hypothetical protein
MGKQSLRGANATSVIRKPAGGDTSQVFRRFVAGGEREHSTSRLFLNLLLRGQTPQHLI